MNTFHPYHDEDHANSDNEFTEQEMFDNYGIEYNNGRRDSEIDSKMFPPDDSLQEYDLMNNDQDQNHSPAYEGRPKSKSRYDQPQETGHFQQRRQWEPRDSKVGPSKRDVDMHMEDLNQKDRHFSQVSPINEDPAGANYYPDVSQYDENEQLALEDNDPLELSNDGMRLLEYHNEFVNKIIPKMGIVPEQHPGFQQFNKNAYTLILNKELSASEKMERMNYLLKDFLESYQQMNSQPTQTPQKVESRPSISDQNQHPNIQSRFEESKLAGSNLGNVKFTPNKMDRTPERKFLQSQVEITPGARAQQYDHVEEEERKEDDFEDLPLKDRLYHKNYHARKLAYDEIAQLFERAGNGEKFTEITPSGEEVEYNPLQRYEE